MPAWCKNERCSPHWLDWGGDSVVYEARSGQTYQFAPMAAAVMACLEARPHSEDELAMLIAQDLSVGVDNELRSALKSIVEQFHRLGWIHPISKE